MNAYYELQKEGICSQPSTPDLHLLMLLPTQSGAAILTKNLKEESPRLEKAPAGNTKVRRGIRVSNPNITPCA